MVSIPHVRALDGLRGVAVIGVLLSLPDLLLGGYLGVDLFFVLSGFLITSLLLAEAKGTSKINLGAFWARRARRLLPAIGVLIFGVAIFCVLFAEAEELGRIRRDAFGTMFYVANWTSIGAGQDYWSLFLQPSPLEHSWSLAIEEQFYVVWPLVFSGLLVWRKDRVERAVLVLGLVGAVAAWLLMAKLYDPADTTRAYFGTDTRAGAVLIGAALAASLKAFGHVRGRLGRIAIELLGLAGLVTLGYMWSHLGGKTPRLYEGGFAIAEVASIAVIAAAMHPHRGPIAKTLSIRPLVWFGLISYGLYLWHWPVDIVLDADRTGLSPWPLFFLRTIVAVGIALMSYFFVEMPIRRGAVSAKRWKVLIPSLAAGLVVIVVLVTAGARAPTNATALSGWPQGGVLIVGDSVAITADPGFERAGYKSGTVWSPGCRLLKGTLRFQSPWSDDCDWEKEWNQAITVGNPDIVGAIIGKGDLFDIKPRGQTEFLIPGTPEWATMYKDAVEKAVAILGARGAKLIFPNIPCQGSLPGAPKFVGGSSLDVARVRAANEVLAQVAKDSAGKVAVPDLFGFLCPNGTYQRALRGVDPVRYDGTHYSEDGADLIVNFLKPYLGTVKQHAPTKSGTNK